MLPSAGHSEKGIANTPDSAVPDVGLYEWYDEEVSAPSASGNLFDVDASVTWTHEDGATRDGQAFYSGSGDTFVFRLGAELEGTWTGSTTSSVSELDGLTIEVVVGPPDPPKRIGYAKPNAGDQIGWYWQRDGALWKRTPRLIMWNDVTNITEGNIADNVDKWADDYGFTGAHIPNLGQAWFDSSTSDLSFDGTETNPDPTTFDLLEALILAWSAKGGFVHFWMYGDAERTMSRDDLISQAGSTVEQRLNDYIIARLGPVPQWTMGIGFDLDEWLSETEMDTWLTDFVNQFGWHHWIGGRYSQADEAVNAGNYPQAGIDFNTLKNDQQFAGWEHHQDEVTNTEIEDAETNVADRPHFSSDRFRRRDEGRSKDFSADSEVPGVIERFGIRDMGAIYGRYVSQTDLAVLSEEWSNPADILAANETVDEDEGWG